MKKRIILLAIIASAFVASMHPAPIPVPPPIPPVNGGPLSCRVANPPAWCHIP